MKSHFLGFNWPLLVRTVTNPIKVLVFVHFTSAVAVPIACVVDLICLSNPQYCEWRRFMETRLPHDPILMLIGIQCVIGLVAFLVLIVFSIQEIFEGFSKERHRRSIELMDKEQELAEKAASAADLQASMTHYRAMTLLENQIELEELLRIPLSVPAPQLVLPATDIDPQTPTTEEV